MVGQKAEVTDTNEALGEQMQEEAAQELIQGYGHQFLLIAPSYLIGKFCRLSKDLYKHFASQLARLRVLIGRVVAGQQSLAIW